jgi:hypothetical protein
MCLYTNAEYNPQISKFVSYSNPFFPLNPNLVMGKLDFAGFKHSWSQLFTCKGMIHFPYEISTMTIFEQYAANIPLFLPSKSLMKKMIQSKKYLFVSRYTQFGIDKVEKRYYPASLVLPLGDDTWIDWWLDRSDYYREDRDMKYFIFFNSPAELEALLKKVDTKFVSNKMKENNAERKEMIYSSWKAIMDPLVAS